LPEDCIRFARRLHELHFIEFFPVNRLEVSHQNINVPI
jgi:hypothetical protein